MSVRLIFRRGPEHNTEWRVLFLREGDASDCARQATKLLKEGWTLVGGCLPPLDAGGDL